MRNGLSTVLQGSAVEVLIDSRSSLNMVILINKLGNSSEMSRPENRTLHQKNTGCIFAHYTIRLGPLGLRPRKRTHITMFFSVEGTSPRPLVGLLRP
jgi:hypothetical protein